jgi:hypothetical protein
MYHRGTSLCQCHVDRFSKQGHGEIDHLLGLGDHDGLALEAPEPMARPAMVALNGLRRRLALHQLVLRDD